MGNIGFGEILLILLVLLLLFGARRLPELAKGLGKSLREFKKAAREIEDEIEDVTSINKGIGLSEEKKSKEEKESKG